MAASLRYRRSGTDPPGIGPDLDGHGSEMR